MLGIVIWFCANKRKGLVWCEDQGDLALLDLKALDQEAPGPLTPNTWVEVALCDGGTMRQVRRVLSVSTGAGQDAARLLREAEANRRPPLRVVA